MTTLPLGLYSGWDTFAFCANVAANTEAQERYQRIQDVDYTMTLDTKLVGFDALQDNKSGAAGKIRRDGTSVRISFLTTATGFGGAALGRTVRWVPTTSD